MPKYTKDKRQRIQNAKKMIEIVYRHMPKLDVAEIAVNSIENRRARKAQFPESEEQSIFPTSQINYQDNGFGKKQKHDPSIGLQVHNTSLGPSMLVSCSSQDEDTTTTTTCSGTQPSMEYEVTLEFHKTIKSCGSFCSSRRIKFTFWINTGNRSINMGNSKFGVGNSKLSAKRKRHLKMLRYCAKNRITYAELTGKQRTLSKPTVQKLPSSSLEYEDQDVDCLKIQNVDQIEDIPLDLEIFDERNVEESEKNIGKRTRRVKKEKIDYTTKKIIFAKELDAGDIETNTSRKRKSTSNTRVLGQNIAGIKIIFNDIDMFGEQIAFLLKRIPKKLCRELQDTIVTLIKTAYEKHKSKAKKNVTASVSSSTPISQTHGKNIKIKKSKQLAIPEEALSIDSISDVIMGEHTPGETVQATRLLEVELEATSHQRSRNQTTDTFPKPMTLPLELVGSMDCVKQEILDPDESSNITAPEKYKEAQLGKTSDQLNQTTNTFPKPITLPIELVRSMDCVKQETLEPSGSVLLSLLTAPEKNKPNTAKRLFNPFKTKIVNRSVEDYGKLMEKAKKFNIIPK